MTPEEMAGHMARIDANLADIRERRRDRAARQHAHCHFTYRHGRYVSPWYWPTRADAEHASRSIGPDPRTPEAPEVYVVHAPACTCTPRQEG